MWFLNIDLKRNIVIQFEGWVQTAYIFFNQMYLDSYRTPLDNHHKQANIH